MVARTIDDLLSEARLGLERLDPSAAHAALRDGAVLVDTRCAEQRAADGVVPGSMHVPLSVLYWRVDESSGADPRLTDRRRRLIVMCAHGYSSSLAAATLRRLGFDGATDVIGGFEAWIKAGLPVARPG